MRLFSVVFAMVVITILFGNILNKTNIIEQLENQLETQEQHYECSIDSLVNTIDEI